MSRLSTGRRVARMAYLALLLLLVGGGVTAWALLLKIPGLQRLAFAVAGHEVELLAPSWLGLLAALPLLWLAPLFSLSDLPVWQRSAALLVRSAIAVLLVVALARPALPEAHGRVATVFVVDVSDSVPDAALQQAHEFIRAAQADTPGPAYMVTFAQEPREQRLAPDAAAGAPGSTDGARSTGLLPAPERHAEGGDQTDVEAALKMAYGLFPPDHLRRIVLLSDGYETDGDALSEASNAPRFGVRIHTNGFDVARPPEVLVADFELPGELEVGKEATLRADIFSTTATEASLTLWQDDFKEGTPRRVELQPGRNPIELKATVREPGFKRFRLDVQVDSAGDRFAGNNTFTQVAVVRGRPRILVVEGDPRQARYLERALRKQQLDVEVRGPRGVPTTLQELENYDLLMLSDVQASFLSKSQMRLVGTYLRELGGGLIMAGGENSLTLGGYLDTELADLLPVRLDLDNKRSNPSLALVLVIDRSSSMEGPDIELAKEAAKAVVSLLDSGDRVSIIAFDATPAVLVRLQSARNRVRILRSIARLRSGGGTAVFPALQAAYDQIAPSSAAIRHVIVLTDGQAEREGCREIVEEMAAEGITLSTVAVGRDADRGLLSALAEAGRGRSYFAESMRSVPRLFVKETQTVARRSLIEEPFRPVVRGRFRMLGGVDLRRTPYLLGYVTTRERKGAELLLATEQGDPLLARWKVGLGTAVVWTSDIKNRWALEWVRWPHFGPFWAQIVRDTMRQRRDLGFDLRAEVVQGQARLTLDAIGSDDRFVNGLQTEVEVRGPKGLRQTVALAPEAAGRYAARFPLPHFGSYSLKATHTLEGKRLGTTLGGVANPYPPELLHHGVQAKLLRQVAARSGGRVQVRPEQVYEAQGEQLKSHRELRLRVILAALALLLVDVFLRRVRLGRARALRFP